MGTAPGSSSIAPPDVAPSPRALAGGAKFGAVLVALGPWIAALSGGLQGFLFVADLETPPLQRAAHWALFGVALGCAFAISRHLWRGVHDGRILPLRLLLISTLPLWLLAELVGQYLALQLLRGGNAYGVAESSMLRVAGQFMAWGMTGSVVFGLAICAFLWRPPARRMPGIALAWASLVPLALFVLWVLVTVQVRSLEVRSSLFGYAWVSLPVVLGLAGAALGDNARAHPRPDWLIGVGLGALLVFVAAAAVATGWALVDAQVLQGGYDARDHSPTHVIERAARVACLGLPLAALPLLGFVARLQRWPSPSAWLLVALPFAMLALAWAIDAAGPGAEHGLAAAYPRRLHLLAAYAVLAPILVLALRRAMRGDELVRDGLVLATALFGLLWLAWRPGLLVLMPMPASGAGSAESAPPPAATPPPPPPSLPAPPPKLIVERVPSGAAGELEVESVETGAEFGRLPGGVVGAEPPPLATPAPPPPPAQALIVTPDALKAQRISGTEVHPPAALYADRPRTVLTAVLHVRPDGAVSRVELMKSSGNPELDEHVRSALETWRFRPWMAHGRAVPVRAPLTFIFVGQRPVTE